MSPYILIGIPVLAIILAWLLGDVFGYRKPSRLRAVLKIIIGAILIAVLSSFGNRSIAAASYLAVAIMTGLFGAVELILVEMGNTKNSEPTTEPYSQ